MNEHYQLQKLLVFLNAYQEAQLQKVFKCAQLLHGSNIMNLG